MIYRARLFGAEKMADSGVLFLYVSFFGLFCLFIYDLWLFWF